MKTLKNTLLGLLLAALGIGSAYALTATEVWNSYNANPDAHGNIPNFSYSGYRSGIVPIPTVPVVTDLVANHGGNGNGSFDNTTAFRNAIAFAKSKGGGAIFIPAGTYNVTGLIHLNGDGVVLRGAGAGSTTIRFTRHLNSALWTWELSKNWSWSGGLLWISPDDTFGSNGRLTRQDGSLGGTADHSDRYEQWKSGGSGTNYSGPILARLTANASRGSQTVQVDSTANLSEGQWVLMTWRNTSDNSLLKHMAGHSLMASFPWTVAASGKILPAILPRYRWPVQIKSISGNTVTLAQPLRINASVTPWEVDFQRIGKYLQEVGVEDLRLMTTGTAAVPHHEERFNCLYMNRVINAWVRRVTIHNCENGLINAETKHVTSDQVTVSGSWKTHHPFAVRHKVADILHSRFNSSVAAIHGVNVEKMATGVVYSNGSVSGTLDSHKQMPFDVLRTQINLNNAGGAGGAGDAGPRLGRNIVHWNIGNSGSSGTNVNQSDLHSFGGLIGVRGPKNTGCANSMVCGNKGFLLADDGLTPAIANLYVQQVNKRKAETNWVEITNLFDRGKATGPNVTVNAFTNVKSGSSVTRVEFLVDGGVQATDTSAPYSATLNLSPGTYALRARLFDNLGGNTLSYPVSVTVEGGGIPTASLSVTPAERSVPGGAAGSASYTVSASGGTASVNLGVSGAPAGATATLNPTTISGTGASSSALQVTTAATTPVGSHTLTVSGTDTGSGNPVAPKTVQLNVTGTTPVCVNATSNGAWNNTSFATQTGTFTAEFDATPTTSTMINGVVGLSNGPQTGYAGLAAIVRFNATSKTIDARNGGAYAATTSIPYTSGTSYHFRLVVNVATRRYTAFVTPAGQAELVVGQDFAFRTEQAGVTQLNNWAVNLATTPTGSLSVCDFEITP